MEAKRLPRVQPRNLKQAEVEGSMRRRPSSSRFLRPSEFLATTSQRSKLRQISTNGISKPTPLALDKLEVEDGEVNSPGLAPKGASIDLTKSDHGTSRNTSKAIPDKPKPAQTVRSSDTATSVGAAFDALGGAMDPSLDDRPSPPRTLT